METLNPNEDLNIIIRRQNDMIKTKSFSKNQIVYDMKLLKAIKAKDANLRPSDIAKVESNCIKLLNS